MRAGQASLTAQRVAAYRLSFDRVAAPYGDAAADETLARDIAGQVQVTPMERMGRYLRARTAFFDRVVVGAIGRGISQIVIVGAGYDGRALRYSRPDVSWWEVDHPSTQADKRARLERLAIGAAGLRFVPYDLEADGLGERLLENGFDAGLPALFCCEGVTIYLTERAVETTLSELASIAAPGSRLAISLQGRRTDDDGRRERFHEWLRSIGEEPRSSIDVDDAPALLARTGWKRVELRDRAATAGLVLAERATVTT